MENKTATIVSKHRDFYYNPDKINAEDTHKLYQEDKLYKGFYIFPLFVYSHGGISLGLARQCRWDSSYCGHVLVKKKKGTYNRDKARERALSYLKEVEMDFINEY